MNTIKARVLYAVHMLAPLSFVLWHIERLDLATLLELRRLFP